MEIEYLYEFTVIAELQSFTRAAEQLCISQSSLSKHMLTLERELGAPLLERSSRSVNLSALGREVFPIAREMAALNRELRAAVEARNLREKRTLAIASLPVMAQYGIPGLLAAFRRENPEVKLEIAECERQELTAMLEEGQCELAFARQGLEEDENLEFLPVIEDRLVAAVGEGHPLAGRASVSIGELKDENLLFLDQRTGFHHLYSALCIQAGFVPNIVYTGHRPENILELAAEGMGVALVMQGHADYVRPAGVKVIPVCPEVRKSIGLARRKGRESGPLAKKFWAFVQNYSEGE